MTGRRVDIDLALPRDPSAPGVARRELRRFAGTLPQRVLGDLGLVVSELVANAVVHGHGAIRLRLRVDAGEVWGEVTDAGGGFVPELREVGPFSVGGRGLLIVDRLTTRWGVDEDTTHVWFEILTTSRTRPDTRRPPVDRYARRSLKQCRSAVDTKGMLIADPPAQTLFYVDGMAVNVATRTDTAAFVVPATRPKDTPRIVALRDLRSAP